MKKGIDYCIGFHAAGISAGIKKNGKKDLGIIISESPANAAGVFTTNRVQAAPVVLDRERITSGICRAIIVNSGNANCCTGEQGIRDARAMTGLVARELGISEDMILVASTGVIGQPLPIEKITRFVPGLIKSAESEGFQDFAEAIMTTDTVPKIILREGDLDGKRFKVMGIAKGAGMIHPNMATLLGFICTDIQATSTMLQDALNKANEKSFNRITIDGDTSTNDTVLIIANGMSGAVIKHARHQKTFQDILDDVMVSLSRLVIKDAEGATKLVEIIVTGAKSNEDARIIADTVAGSSLVKTALFGEDANWGRILAAAGRAGVPVEPDKTEIYFNDVAMVKAGKGCGPEAEAEATKVLCTPEFSISIHLNMGSGHASVLTCDFSIDYVKINADYRS